MCPGERGGGVHECMNRYAFSDHCPPPFELMSAFVEVSHLLDPALHSVVTIIDYRFRLREK